MPTTTSFNFPRYLLPAFPRWDPSLLKRNRPIEDVTQPRSSSRSSNSPHSEESSPIPRQARIQSHDSGCMISDDEEEDEEEVEVVVQDEQSYTSASSSPSSSSNSLEIYLDTESGYGGSDEEVIIGSPSSSTSHPSSTIQSDLPQPEKRKHFWSRKRPSPPTVVAPEKPTLPTTTSYLHCSTCRTHLCFASSIISKGFTGRHGRAYLVTSIVPENIIHGKPTSRALQTGAHTVSDISCNVCGSNLGWKYIHAEERSQRYKIGKYILETGRVEKVNYWDGAVDEPEELGTPGVNRGRRTSSRKERDWRDGWEVGWETPGDDSDGVEVDLADEEELEEMFNGSWNKDKVLRRRERKRQIEDMRRNLDSNV
ncbi:hypothetical protein ABW19_dt0204512 [Dactylella cylindrospora]|nr:hypothetical protein ABW19_dt0204512 [Dactylella cylindrospora]